MKRTILYLLAVVSLCCGCDKEKNALREGNKQFEKKAFDKAESAYRNSLAADSLYKTAEYNLAAASYKQGKSDKLLSAAKYYESYLLSLDHNDTLQTSACTYDMANTYFQISQSDSIKASEQSKLFLQKAAELYKQSLRLNPQDTNAKYNLALTQHLLKEEEKQKGEKKDKTALPFSFPYVFLEHAQQHSGHRHNCACSRDCDSCVRLPSCRMGRSHRVDALDESDSACISETGRCHVGTDDLPAD